MKRMRKKASMLSLMAYLISIILIAIVLYKVFAFSIEKYPAIEVRELSNEYDYALNAPEDVKIPHFLPQTYFGSCGIGAVLFEVTKDSDGDLVEGDKIGISRCGDGCIDYFNTMTGIMAAMLAWDLAQGTLEAVLAPFGAHIIANAMGDAVRNSAKQAGKGITREAVESFIKKQGKGKIKTWIMRRAVNAASKSALGKVFGVRVLRQAAKQAGKEVITKSMAKAAWKGTTRNLLKNTVGRRVFRFLRVKAENLFGPIRNLAPSWLARNARGQYIAESVWRVFSDNPYCERELVENKIETNTRVIVRGSLDDGVPITRIIREGVDDQALDISAGYKTAYEAIDTLAYIPTTTQNIDIITDKIQDATIKSPIWAVDTIEGALSQVKRTGSWDPIIDLVRHNDQLGDVFLRGFKEASVSSPAMRSTVKQAVINSGNDILQENFVARILAKAGADAFYDTSSTLIKRIKQLVARPAKISKIFAKYTVGLEAKVAYAYTRRVVPGGTATGAGARDAIGISFGFFEEHVLGLPHPGHFLGLCCFKTDYSKRFAIEMGQFASALLGMVPLMGFVQAGLDKLTLDIYSEEFDLCKRDIFLYGFIQDTDLNPSIPGYTQEKKAKRWTGLIETDTILINYVDSPKIIFLNKSIVDESITGGMIMNVIAIEGG